MQDIKPDTSLYTDLPNRLRALALILDGKNVLQERPSHGDWFSVGTFSGSQVARNCVERTHDYRLKPKPRELWVAFSFEGQPIATFTEPLDNINAVEVLARGATVVRFVEQPE